MHVPSLICLFKGVAESPSSFLESKVFEILLPGLEETLKVAKVTEVSSWCS